MSRPPFDPNRIRVDGIDSAAGDDSPCLTVHRLTQLIKNAITQHLPSTVHVMGEISNFKRHSSGHLYFVMKDAHSELACVMWRSAVTSLKFEPADGLSVIATGYVDVFERSGRYQLYVRRLEPRGVGALDLAFRQLREKLEREGLFDPKRKRPLPRFPQRIAVVTSPTGAAIRDILQTLRRRFPCLEVLVYPVAVQGPAAAEGIARAIERINSHRQALHGIDVIIVGRGGGSLEDLWAFNEEVVARAIHASQVPVISAVGHETDVTISDWVADVRAPTPTAAAEMVAPARDEVLAHLTSQALQISRIVHHRRALCQTRFDGILRRRAIREPLTAVRIREQMIDDLLTRTQRAGADRIHGCQRILARFELALQRIRPEWLAARLCAKLDGYEHRLHWALNGCVNRSQRILARFELALQRIRPEWLAARLRAKLDSQAHRLRWASNVCVVRGQRTLESNHRRLASWSPQQRISTWSNHVLQLQRRLEAMSHRNTLRRGFTITRKKRRRELVRDPGNVRDGDVVITETAAGEFESRVFNLHQKELFEQA